MSKSTRVDLTAIDGEPTPRAEIQLITGPPARQPNGDSGRHPALGHAVHRSILAVDIERSTNQTNSAKATLRHMMYGLLETTLGAAGLDEHVRDELVDRGDGVLVLIHPVDTAPKALLLDTVVPTLVELLIEHNRRTDIALRLRAVIHAGDVLCDGRGWFGEPLDLAFRLLDAPGVKRRLFHTAAPLVLVVSDDIYRTTVIQGYAGIDRRGFVPAVRVRVNGHRHQGWVQILQQQRVAQTRAAAHSRAEGVSGIA